MERGIFVPMMIPAFPDNPCAGGGSGTVTSVGITAPAMFAVANSPITTSGTIALTLTTQQKSHVLIGPVANPPAAPTFRNLVADDIATGSAGPTHVLRGNMTWGNETVTSVNTQTGAVNLTAANVGAAATVHTHAASDIVSGVIATARLASTGVASATTFLRGDQSWSAAPVTSVNTQTGAVNLTAANVGAAATVHTHAASDIVSGVIATARLASTGTASSTTFLRGDQTWATPTAAITGFTPSQNTAAPNNVVNSSRLLVDAVSTNANMVLQPKGSGGILAQLPDGTATGGNARGIYAIDLQLQRSSATAVASGASTIAIGQNNTASGQESIAIGKNNLATAIQATSIGIFNNCSSNNSIGVGSNNVVAASNSGIFGIYCSCAVGSQNSYVIGYSSQSLTDEQFIAGNGNTVTGAGMSAIGTANNCIGGYYGTILGHNHGMRDCTDTSVCLGNGALAFCNGIIATADYNFANLGDCQKQESIVRGETIGAVTFTLANGQTGLDVPKVLANSTNAFEILLTARRTDVTTEHAAFRITGLIANGAIVGAVTYTTIANSFAVAPGVNISTAPVLTGHDVRINVTGIAGKTIRYGAILKLITISVI